MLEQIKGIELKGANFVNQTYLNLFNSPNDKVEKVALVYGRNGLSTLNQTIFLRVFLLNSIGVV